MGASNRLCIYQNYTAVVTNNLKSHWLNGEDHELSPGGKHSQIVNGCPFSFLMLVKYSVLEPGSILIHILYHHFSMRYLWCRGYAS